MTVDKKQTIINLVQICYLKGIRKIVFSPGSRNAPLIIAFNDHGGFETFSIHDERSAAFFALGMAQQTGETVGIISTSGSAALNYAPAIAEAFYQRIPLLVMTADRPPEWIDQGDSQTMRQRNLYQNFIKKSFEIRYETTDHDELWFNSRIYNEAINDTRIEPRGPVHINIPLREPLYEFEKNFGDISLAKIFDQFSPPPRLSESVMDELAEEWNQAKRKLILCGITPKSKALNDLLVRIAEDPSVIVLTETTSNLGDVSFIEQIDRILFSINPEDHPTYKPDLLLTFGTNIVSKKIKSLFRQWEIPAHWHVDETDVVIDTYKKLTRHLRSDLQIFFTELLSRRVTMKSEYQASWHSKNRSIRSNHFEFMEQAGWSDLLAYSMVLDQLPKNAVLQMANSTAVRYVQLMEKRADISYHANRGVAGIDGCSSTAVGAAWSVEPMTVLVTGETAFFYDSNALWIPYMKGNLRIVVFNNQGGNIFRFIPGPDTTPYLENFFEAHHQVRAGYLAKTFNIPYYNASDEDELSACLSEFLKPQLGNRPAILEIFTPRFKNDKMLKAYFKFL